MRFFLALCLWLFVAVQANAVVRMNLSNGASVEGFPKNCAEVVSMLQSKYANAPTLTRCSSANESYTVYAKNPSSGSDYVWVTLYLSEVCDGSRFSADGSKPLGQKCVRLQCNEGDALGSYKVATAYWQISPHVLKQPIMADADAKNYKVCIQGCVAKTTDVSGCNDATTVAPNLELVKCTLAMQETSQKCQIWGDPTDTPAFTGSVGPGDGSGTGNEPTDPENPGGGTGGDGGTPGGGTGGTPGGG
ncbi:hypothetical protein [Janthinobacterium sp. AD80]|uniref:hypothetical protein n=1 Tax=Janthinobacterium sp. AD80 TaxID=1528773 RepID=UPI000CC2A952|nr:hypothetical protein [Janthinobacterium sp. AD80]PMQ16329.1 hypothetical protein JaAD80_10745 [Janthinobacterium sp. AD80]